MATQPELISVPFANAGAKNAIPQTTAVLGKASLTNGFPTETSMPLEDGGIPPRREDFNGMLYWLSTFAIYQQAGGLFTYNTTVDYSVPSIVYYNGDLWWCLQENGPATVVKSPSADNSAYWIKFKNYVSSPLDAYPVGSYYISSVSTSPAELFGGTWVEVRDKMILAAGTTYTAGTLENPATGGSATKTLTVENIPSHVHTFTTADGGEHTHTVSGSTQSAGAHTHGVSGTTYGGGSHSHTRGSMNITGQLSIRKTDNTDNDSLVLYGGTSGAFYVGGEYNNESDAVRTTSPRWTRLTMFDASRSWSGSSSTASNHTHGFSATSGSSGSHYHSVAITVGIAGKHSHMGTTNGAGNGTAFDVMNPYIVAYVWRRTA